MRDRAHAPPGDRNDRQIQPVGALWRQTKQALEKLPVLEDCLCPVKFIDCQNHPDSKLCIIFKQRRQFSRSIHLKDDVILMPDIFFKELIGFEDFLHQPVIWHRCIAKLLFPDGIRKF